TCANIVPWLIVPFGLSVCSITNGQGHTQRINSCFCNCLSLCGIVALKDNRLWRSWLEKKASLKLKEHFRMHCRMVCIWVGSLTTTSCSPLFPAKCVNTIFGSCLKIVWWSSLAHITSNEAVLSTAINKIIHLWNAQGGTQ